jgi:predicted nucleic acid-binding protein
MVWYLDTSAFLKLVVVEPESRAMRSWMIGSGPCWSSQLLRTEALRAGDRLGVSDEVVAEALEGVSLVNPAPSTFLAAGRLRPAALRSLDALHLATALELGADLEGLVTYDARLIEAARIASLEVVTPT